MNFHGTLFSPSEAKQRANKFMLLFKGFLPHCLACRHIRYCSFIRPTRGSYAWSVRSDALWFQLFTLSVRQDLLSPFCMPDLSSLFDLKKNKTTTTKQTIFISVFKTTPQTTTDLQGWRIQIFPNMWPSVLCESDSYHITLALRQMNQMFACNVRAVCMVPLSMDQ